jgi:hypothetical protein
MFGLFSGCTSLNDVSGSPQSKTGGTNTAIKNINLKDIDIAEQDGSVVLTFSLISGSRTAGYSESKLTKLPPYKIEMLDQPQRLAITFENIGFWDYEKPDSMPMPGFLLGMFQEVPADSDSLTVYLQLSKAASFKSKELEGMLIVTLTPGDENTQTKYYCAANAFYQHQEGKWPKSIDMKPVLCSDLQNKLLISQPFGTREEAQSYLDSISDTVKSALPGIALSVVGVAKNALPDFSAEIDYSQVESNIVLTADGKRLDTPVLLENGRYLDTASDGRIAFSREYKTDEPALEQDAYLMSESLWILDTGGLAKNIDVSDSFLSKRQSFLRTDAIWRCLIHPLKTASYISMILIRASFII